MNKERLEVALNYYKKGNILDSQVNPLWYGRGKTSPIIEDGTRTELLAVLDRENFYKNKNYFRNKEGEIKIEDWAMHYFELSRLEYLWIFSMVWDFYELHIVAESKEEREKYRNSKTLWFIQKLEYFLEHKEVPKGFKFPSKCDSNTILNIHGKFVNDMFFKKEVKINKVKEK